MAWLRAHRRRNEDEFSSTATYVMGSTMATIITRDRV